MVTEEDIVRYYDQCEWHYKQHLKLDQCMAMHYGYWTPGTATLADALANTNAALAAKARIGPSDHVLDAGCGVGGSSIYLARTFGCQVLGITLPDAQVASAHKHADRLGVSHLARFEKRNYCDTGLPAETFDVVWAIESVCHANDKQAFIEEAYRVLRPKGRLVMVDYFQEKATMTDEEARLLARWLDGWAIPGLATLAGFNEHLSQTGFHTVTTEDTTALIRPSAKRLYHRFWLGFPIQKLYEWFSQSTEVQRKSVRTARLQYDALQQGLWRYHELVAVK